MQSKLPHLGTSIFSEMSMMASRHNAINLSQGFPEFDSPDWLKDALKDAVARGLNQYAPSPGLPQLLQETGMLVNRHYGYNLEPMHSITVTSGATEALWVAIQAVVRNGDEVIIFDPAYDSYQPAVELAGGRCIRLPLNAPDYSVDWQQVAAAINTNTRAIIINSPHNPTGTLLGPTDMASLQALVLKHNLYLISDEVYEFITFDGLRHESVLRYPELFERSFVVSSFGKTFHCTGWKIGYCVAPKQLTEEFRKIHQYVTFSSFTPAQQAISVALAEHPQHTWNLASFYQQKRDYLTQALSGSKLNVLPSKGTYFLLADYAAVSSLEDVEFCHWLTQKVGVAAIPLSPFYQQKSTGKVIRLCFAKNDETLNHAATKLCQL